MSKDPVLKNSIYSTNCFKNNFKSIKKVSNENIGLYRFNNMFTSKNIGFLKR